MHEGGCCHCFRSVIPMQDPQPSQGRAAPCADLGLGFQLGRAPSWALVGSSHHPDLQKDHHMHVRQEERQELSWPLHRKLLNADMKVLGGGEL